MGVDKRNQIDKLSPRETIKLALRLIKDNLIKVAEENKSLINKTKVLEEKAILFEYNEKIAAMASEMVDKGIVPEEEKFEVIEDLKNKYASLEDIPDLNMVFGEFGKYAAAMGSTIYSEDTFGGDPALDKLIHDLRKIVKN